MGLSHEAIFLNKLNPPTAAIAGVSLFSIFQARTARVSMVSRTIQTRSFQGMFAGNWMKDQLILCQKAPASF
jgi:hypothetical protein